MNRRTQRLFIVTLTSLFFFGPVHGSPKTEIPPVKKTVFLMHGILNASFSMKRIESALRKRGFKVVNLNYPSRSKTIEEHAQWLAQEVAQKGEGSLYFVGHSLGAIIIRCYLARHAPANVVRFVMIAPPNHGSITADKIGDTLVYRLLWGNKAGQELRVTRKDFWETLPAPKIEFGIIAGAGHRGRGLNPWLSGDNDGTVSVEEARLEGAKAFTTLPYQHTQILFRKKTIKQTIHFLETGFFTDAP